MFQKVFDVLPLPAEWKGKPDPLTSLGEADLATERKRAETRKVVAEATEARISVFTAGCNLLYRLLFAPLMLGVAIWWLNYVSDVLDRQGRSGGDAELLASGATTQPSDSVKAFALSDGVLIALLTTTTVNVLALLLAVLTYLFWRRGGGKGA